MDWKTIITASVVAAAVSAFSSIYVTLLNNRRLHKIEEEKREYQRADFVITKLYSLLERLEGLHGFVNTIGDRNKTINDAIERRPTFIEIYKTSRPIIFKKFRSEIDDVIAEEENKYNLFLQHYLVEKAIDDSALEWCAVANRMKDSLSIAIQNQISFYFDKEGRPHEQTQI